MEICLFLLPWLGPAVYFNKPAIGCASSLHSALRHQLKIISLLTVGRQSEYPGSQLCSIYSSTEVFLYPIDLLLGFAEHFVNSGWLVGFDFKKSFFFFQLCFTSLRKPIHLVNKNEWFMQSTSTFSCPQWAPRLIEWDRFVFKKLQIPWEKSIQNKEVCKGGSDQFSSGEIRKRSKGLWVQTPPPPTHTYTHTLLPQVWDPN